MSKVIQIFTYLWISLALSVAVYECFSQRALHMPGNPFLFYSFKNKESYLSIPEPFRSRIIPNFTASKLTELLDVETKQDFERFAGWWHAVFFFGITLILFFYGSDRLYYLFGVFAAVAWTAFVDRQHVIETYGMPVLLCTSALVLCYKNNARKSGFFILALGMLVKETMIAFTPLFKRKMILAFLLCLIIKTIVGSFTQVYGLRHMRDEGTKLEYNLEVLSSPIRIKWPGEHYKRTEYLPSVVPLACAGLLVAALPFLNKKWWLWIVFSSFFTGQMLFAIIYEYHIFVEIAPLALYVIRSSQFQNVNENCNTDQYPPPGSSYH